MKFNGTYIVFAILTLFLFSCKDNTQLLSPNSDDDGPLKYRLSGLKDTSMERIGETKYFFLVEKTAGTPELVTLSADDLPPGMEVKFDPSNPEMPSYNTSLIIKSVRVKEGKYKIKIRSVSPGTGVANNFVNVTIRPYTNVADGLKGAFQETGKCTPQGDINDNVNIVVHETVKNRIIIKGLFSGVMNNEITADINPATNTIIIPTQEHFFLTYNGEGTFDDDKIVINYTIAGATFNKSCSTTLIRK